MSRPPANGRARRRVRTTQTARAAILAVSLVSVALALAVPFKIWLAQREQIAHLRAQTAAQQAAVAQLRQQQQLWNDPAYIEQQARTRLHYAFPGQTTYLVLTGPPKVSSKPAAPSTATGSATQPWWTQLWGSDTAAGSTTGK